MITLPRGRTLRLVTGFALLFVTFLFLHGALGDTSSSRARLSKAWNSGKAAAAGAAAGFRDGSKAPVSGAGTNGEKEGVISGVQEKASRYRLLHQPKTPYTRADVDFAERAGMTLVPVDSVAPIRNQSFTPPTPLVKGVIVMLARNTDADGAAKSITELEKRFNGRWRYPYVFLNELPFDDNFKNKLQAVNPSADMKFGLIPVVHWSYPSWINQTRAAAARKAMHEAKIIYGGHEAYRHMCRYNSGFFYRHELLDEYDYYWRVEPDVHFYCDIDEDPFRFMQENNKLYGFTVSLTEFRATIPTLWETTRAFMTENPSYIRTEDNAVRWISKDLKDYNLCHFWSNFEIGSLHLWRSKAYEGYFEHLDHAGGFFYERWGDAPVHSIGATLLLKPSQIHFFNNIGYDHTGINHCPIDQPAFANKCQCNGLKNFDMTDWSCTPEWFDLFGGGEANKAAEEKRKVNEQERRKKDQKEKEENEARAKVEKEAKEKADKGAKEKAEREAKETAEREKIEKGMKAAKENAKKGENANR